MDIVQQFQSLSHSPFPLLSAPAPRLMLSAPKVAGFLPARIAPPFTDTILMHDDPTPAPFVSIDREKLPPGLLKIIGHLPTPDEYDHMMAQEIRRVASDMDSAYHAYRAWRERNP